MFRRVRKMRKAIISFVMTACLPACLSVCLSVCMEQLGSHLTSFHENRCFRNFLTFVTKIQFLLKLEKNDGTLREGVCAFLTECRLFLLRMRNVSDKFVQKIKLTFDIQ